MQSTWTESESNAWTQIAPMLDAALAKLGKKDHDAVVLRFFENKNFNEVGAAIGTNESAAKMRVGRALEKLRKFFSKNGVVLSVATIASAVSENSVHAAPIGLAKTISAVALTKGATVSISTATLIKGALKIMAWTKMKTAIIGGVAIIFATGATVTIIAKRHASQNGQQQNQLSDAFIPMSQWSFKGHDTPEAGYESFNWALRQGDLNTFLDQFTPKFRQIEVKGIGARSDVEIESNMVKEASQVAAYLVVSNQMVSADECILHIRSPKIGNCKATMKKIANEWKVDSIAPDRGR